MMTLTKNYCKECFRTQMDDTAQDRFLLMSGSEEVCACCKQKRHVVTQYFKYGEMRVSNDGKHYETPVKRVKINPEYSCWGDRNPYVAVDNT